MRIRFAVTIIRFNINAEDGIQQIFLDDAPALDAFFNLQGQPINDTRVPGLYIIQGRKVLVK